MHYLLALPFVFIKSKLTHSFPQICYLSDLLIQWNVLNFKKFYNVLYDSSHIELPMPYLEKSLENSLYLADIQKELTETLRRIDLQQIPLGCDFQ